MPYQEHESFSVSNEQAIIYKYMSFYKFTSLISTESMFFCKADKFSDPMEGCYPRILYNLTHDDLKELFKKNQSLDWEAQRIELLSKQYYELIRDAYRNRGKYAICSFCTSESEYEGLWKLYSSIDDGVCIKTDIQGLKNSFNLSKDRAVFIGEVAYYHESDLAALKGAIFANLFYPYLAKRAEYSIEKEIRAVISEEIKFRDQFPQKFDNDYGHFVKVHLHDLIQEIILAPNCNDAFQEVVTNLVRDKGLGNIPIKKSILFKPPLEDSGED